MGTLWNDTDDLGELEVSVVMVIRFRSTEQRRDVLVDCAEGELANLRADAGGLCTAL